MTSSPGPDRRRVFLHVGSPKTGTTFLQDVLWSQRDKAAEQGLLLPGERFGDHFLATLDVRGMVDRPGTPPRATGMWQRMVDEATAWPGTTLISHELFAAATQVQARQAIAAFPADMEVHVVLTARDLVRQIPAEWQEHVKHRSTATFPEFIANISDPSPANWFWKVQDFAAVLERWGGGLPRSQVHVVTVPPRGADPTALWKRFATLLDLDADAFDTDQRAGNTSLGLEQVDLLRRVNLALGDTLGAPGVYPALVKTLFAQKILAGRTGARLELDEATTAFGEERSRDQVARLVALGVDVVGDLEDLAPALSTTPRAALLDPAPEDVLDEASAAIAALLGELHAERHARRELRRRARERPLRFALIQASERSSTAAAALTAYRRGTAVARRLRPGR